MDTPPQRHLAANLTDEDKVHLVQTQIALARYLRSPESLPVRRDRAFRDNETAWSAILRERIRASMAIRLEDFFVLEWFPSAPGLFFTERGRQSRASARSMVERIDRLSSEERYAIGSSGDQVIVYNPYGKVAMLQGGLGTVRMKPRPIDGEDHWFMSASSNGVAHEGLPLAVPSQLRDRLIDEIADHGGVSATITGQLQFVPRDLQAMYEHYIGVPQLYLKVSELQLTKASAVRGDCDLSVSIAVSFISSYEGKRKFYASYVFFDPSRDGSFERNVDWMENAYVKGTYQGSIVTDFDESMRRFSGAKFSIATIMDGTLDRQQVERGLSALDLPASTVTYIGQMFLHEEVHMGDKITTNVSGSTVGAVAAGKGARAIGTVTTSSAPTQAEHRKSIGETQAAVVRDQEALDALDSRIFDALNQFLRLARDIQVEQKSLRETQVKMKETLDEVWAQEVAKGMKPQVLPKTLEVMGAIAANPIMVEVAKKLIGA
jgi:hypothetical protein